jgi:signal transduction histidine kinase
MSRLEDAMRRHSVDLLIVAGAVEASLEVLLRQDADGAPELAPWLAAIATGLVVAVLLGRRRLPFASPASVWILAAALSFADGRLVVFTFVVQAAGLAAAWLLGQSEDRWAGLAVVVVGAAIVVHNDPSASGSDFLFLPALFAIAWLTGFRLRERGRAAQAAETRALQAEREREAAARLAVAEERTRIARELHDIVAHAMSVIVLQVGAVRRRLPAELGEDREALHGVERTGREALTQMRLLLDAMRRDEEDAPLTPQGGLEGLDGLLDGFGRAGLPVRLHRQGTPAPLPAALDLSVYRIVQEGLTNALKHSGAERADVVLGYEPDEIRIEVRDHGRGVMANGRPAGYGLVGVRERVKLYGGEMTAGDAEGGGFRLRARLPLNGGRG